MCFYVAFEDEIHKTNCEQFTIQTCRACDDSSCWVLVLIFIPASFRKYVKGFSTQGDLVAKNLLYFTIITESILCYIFIVVLCPTLWEVEDCFRWDQVSYSRVLTLVSTVLNKRHNYAFD